MEGGMLVMQALAEKCLLGQKLRDRIGHAVFVDLIQPGEDGAAAAAELCRNAERELAQIRALIRRYRRLEAAIAECNARTELELSWGKCTVATAVLLRKRLLEDGYFRDSAVNFETQLLERMEETYASCCTEVQRRSRRFSETAESIRQFLPAGKGRENDLLLLELLDSCSEGAPPELADPINIRKRIEELKEKKNLLLAELDAEIRISDATTYLHAELPDIWAEDIKEYGDDHKNRDTGSV